MQANKNQALIAAYRLAMKRRNLSPLTIDRRARLLAALGRRWDLTTITAEDLEEHIQSRDLVARSRNAFIADMQSFFVWMMQKGNRYDNPVDDLERSRVPRLLPRPIAEKDLQTALDEARPRMRLWLCLAAFAGLRCCEIATLAAEDLIWHRDPPLILVKMGKGGHQRMVPMAIEVERALGDCDLPRTGFLFRHRIGRDHILAQSVSQLIGKHLHDLGIKASAHMLRHYFLSRVYSETNDLRTTQELAGHVSPTTTATYTAWSPARAAAVVRTFGPRSSHDLRDEMC